MVAHSMTRAPSDGSWGEHSQESDTSTDAFQVSSDKVVSCQSVSSTWPSRNSLSSEDGSKLLQQAYVSEFSTNTTSEDGAEEDEDEEKEQLSFAELAMREDLLDKRGKPAFAKATHFVSHAWRYIFGPFVEAVRHWVEETGVSEDVTYFWVDAFVVNQNQSQKYPQEWWSTRFMQAVGEIGNTVLVLDSWHNPECFQRAWVIWEMYCTTVTGARLHITMGPETMEDFNETLVTSFEKVQTALSNIDVATSEAFSQTDCDMIHSEIKRTIGFIKLNELVQTRLMQWLLEKGKSRLKALKNEETGDLSVEPGASRIKLADNLARMQRETGNVAEAVVSFEALLTEVMAKLGPNHLFTLSCMNQLAVTYQKSGRMEEAMQLHKKSLTHRVEVLGLHHADALQSTSNLAVLISSQKPLTVSTFEEAQLLFKQAISGREVDCGPSHPSTLYTVSNLAKLLSDAPAPSLELFEEAEALHQRAVSKLTEKLHSTHPLTLTAMHNQAHHWLVFYEFTIGLDDETIEDKHSLAMRAEQLLRHVHNLRTEKLGKQHQDTLLTEQSLMKCNRLLRKLMRKSQFARHKEYTSWAELSVEEFTMPNTCDVFLKMRQRLKHYGVYFLLSELGDLGFVDVETGKLTTGMQPFNIFARLAGGVQVQASMAQEQAKLGKFQKDYLLVKNRPDNDDRWNSTEPAWLGKASMSERHRFLTIKNLHWEWFNVLTFGLVSALPRALRLLRDMKEAAHLWLKSQTDWSDSVGLYLNVHAHTTLHSFHLHIVDMDTLGPTWEHVCHKNLSIDDAIAALEIELDESRGETSV